MIEIDVTETSSNEVTVDTTNDSTNNMSDIVATNSNEVIVAATTLSSNKVNENIVTETQTSSEVVGTTPIKPINENILAQTGAIISSDSNTAQHITTNDHFQHCNDSTTFVSSGSTSTNTSQLPSPDPSIRLINYSPQHTSRIFTQNSRNENNSYTSESTSNEIVIDDELDALEIEKFNRHFLLAQRKRPLEHDYTSIESNMEPTRRRQRYSNEEDNDSPHINHL